MSLSREPVERTDVEHMGLRCPACDALWVQLNRHSTEAPSFPEEGWACTCNGCGAAFEVVADGLRRIR